MKRRVVADGIIQMGLTYRLKLNKVQTGTLETWIKVSRLLYNELIETERLHYTISATTGDKRHLSAFDLQKRVTDLRQHPDYEWVKSLPYEVCETATERVAAAYDKYFDNLKEWKKKGCDGEKRPKPPSPKKFAFFRSIAFKNIKHHSGYAFKIPKLGLAKIYADWVPDNSDVRRAVIRERNGKYYLSVSYEVPAKSQLPKTGKYIGLDVGITKAVTDSEGKTYCKPIVLSEFENKLRVLGRQKSRRKIGSIRRKQSVLAINKMYQKATNIRTHFLHDIANYYISNYDFIAVEDLQVANMVKNKKLAKHILNISWSKLFNILKYKCEWYGKKFVKVHPQYTSQSCSNCGHCEPENRKTQAKFCCIACGHTENADVNAAKNILQLAKNITTE